MEKREVILERVIYVLKDGATLSGLQLEAGTGLGPAELLPALGLLKENHLVFVTPFLPRLGNTEEWGRTYYRATPKLIEAYDYDPNFFRKLTAPPFNV